MLFEATFCPFIRLYIVTLNHKAATTFSPPIRRADLARPASFSIVLEGLPGPRVHIRIPAGQALIEGKVRDLIQDFIEQYHRAVQPDGNPWPAGPRPVDAGLEPLVIEGYAQDFRVGKSGVDLKPLQKALVQFFLLQPEGVRLVDLMDACHVESLTRLYSGVARTGSPETQRQVIHRLVENGDGRLQQHMSVIRARFKAAVGRSVFRQYTIEGRPGEAFAIALCRDRVQWTDSDGRAVDCRQPGKM